MRRARTGTSVTPSPRLAVGAVVVGAALTLAACGSSGAPRTSGGGPPAHAFSPKTQEDVVHFADCMRSHGVSSFPDPTTDPHAYKSAFDNTAPAFVAAETHCSHFLPGGGLHRNQSPVPNHRQIAAQLAFAGCMRRHGIQRFPDPSSGAGITHEMVTAAGVDVHQPAVLQAADACVTVTHGLITKTTVARFVAGN